MGRELVEWLVLSSFAPRRSIPNPLEKEEVIFVYSAVQKKIERMTALFWKNGHRGRWIYFLQGQKQSEN